MQISARVGLSTGLFPLQSNSPLAGIEAACGTVVAFGIATRCDLVAADAGAAPAPLVRPSRPRPIAIPRAVTAFITVRRCMLRIFIGSPLRRDVPVSDPADAFSQFPFGTIEQCQGEARTAIGRRQLLWEGTALTAPPNVNRVVCRPTCRQVCAREHEEPSLVAMATQWSLGEITFAGVVSNLSDPTISEPHGVTTGP